MGTGRKAVLDTNIHISALGWDGPEAEVVREVLKGCLSLALSQPLISELIRVTCYPRFDFTEQEISGYLNPLIDIAEMVDPDFTLAVIEEDPDDNRFLECALAAKAEYIISGDKHLLISGKYEGIELLTAADFLDEL